MLCMSLISRIVGGHQRRIATPIPDEVQRYLPQAGGLWATFTSMANSFKGDLSKLGGEAKDILRANIVDAAKSLSEESKKKANALPRLEEIKLKIDELKMEIGELEEERGDLLQKFNNDHQRYKQLQGEVLSNLRRDSDAFIRKLESMSINEVEDQFTFDQARRRARNYWSSTDFTP